MPKHEIFHEAGNPISSEIRYLIEKYFSEKEIVKLERLGGRIQISVAAPYRAKAKEKIEIKNTLVEQLRSSQRETGKIKKILDQLSVKQLRELCMLLGQPVRSNAVGEEIKRELIRNIQSEEYWQRISKKHQ